MIRLLRYWHNRVPMRVRLTLWYLLSFSAILVSLAIFLHTRVRIALLERTDQALELAADQAEAQIEIDDGRLMFADSPGLDKISGDFTFYLIAPDGTLWDSRGDESTPIGLLSDDSYFTTLIRGKGHGREEWRVHSRLVTTAEGDFSARLYTIQPFDLDNLLGLVRRYTLLSLPLGFALAGIGGVFFARRVMRPIDQITRTAQAISTNGLRKRIHYKGPPDEIGRLATTFDQMLDRLQAGFERERRFTADAAHELRTPLTALKGQIEVTLSQSRAPADYQGTLHDLGQQVDRLIRLSNDLLLMARVDHQMRQTHPDPVNLCDLLAALHDQVCPLVESKSLTWEQHIPPGLVINGNMDLLIRLFLNLFDNAIKYTPRDGTITVRAEKLVGEVRITVRDTGPGIAPECLPHLFERFYRAEQDRARYYDPPGQDGAGLGLAIANEIAHAHGGTLSAQSEVGQGSTFVVNLPLPEK